MIPQIYEVITSGNGFLAVMARPRSGEWLRDEIGGLKGIGIQTISDRSTPRRLTEFQHFVRRLAESARAGRGVAIHCRAGIGRSGIVAAAVLVSLGQDSAEVFKLITRARGVSVPDTPEQIEWFKQNCRGFAVEK